MLCHSFNVVNFGCIMSNVLELYCDKYWNNHCTRSVHHKKFNLPCLDCFVLLHSGDIFHKGTAAFLDQNGVHTHCISCVSLVWNNIVFFHPKCIKESMSTVLKQVNAVYFYVFVPQKMLWSIQLDIISGEWHSTLLTMQ